MTFHGPPKLVTLCLRNFRWPRSRTSHPNLWVERNWSWSISFAQRQISLSQRWPNPPLVSRKQVPRGQMPKSRNVCRFSWTQRTSQFVRDSSWMRMALQHHSSKNSDRSQLVLSLPLRCKLNLGSGRVSWYLQMNLDFWFWVRFRTPTSLSLKSPSRASHPMNKWYSLPRNWFSWVQSRLVFSKVLTRRSTQKPVLCWQSQFAKKTGTPKVGMMHSTTLSLSFVVVSLKRIKVTLCLQCGVALCVMTKLLHPQPKLRRSKCTPRHWKTNWIHSSSSQALTSFTLHQSCKTVSQTPTIVSCGSTEIFRGSLLWAHRLHNALAWSKAVWAKVLDLDLKQLDFVDAWKKIFPTLDPPNLPQGNLKYKIEGLPFGCSHQMLADWASSNNWPLTPFRTLGPQCWVVSDRSSSTSGDFDVQFCTTPHHTAFAKEHEDREVDHWAASQIHDQDTERWFRKCWPVGSMDRPSTFNFRLCCNNHP